MNRFARKNRLRSYFRKHYRGISVLGATLLFFTFSVKEYLGEREKDLLSDIRAVEATTENRERLNQLSKLIENADQLRRAEPESILQMRPALADDISTSTTFDDDFYNAEKMFNAVPHTNQLEQLRDHVKSLQGTVKHDLARMNSLMDSLHNNDARPLTQAEISSLDKFHEDVFQFTQAVPPFVSETLAGAKQTEDSRDHLLQDFTGAGYVLYVIGWLLSVIGKLNEPEGAKAGEIDAG